MKHRALTIVQMLPDLEEGGVECETVEMAGYLARCGHKSIVISGGGRMVETLEAAGSRHVRWPNIGEKSPRCLAYILPLRRLLTHESVDVLHLRSRLPAWIGYLAWKSLPAAARPRLLTTFHGFYSINAYSAIMTKGERVVAVSKAIADHIVEAYGTPQERIEIIHSGFDEDRFNPDRVETRRIQTLRRQWRVDNTTAPVILLPGRITRLKGHDFFIRSLGRIQHLPWIAVCAGDVDDSSELVRELRDSLKTLNLEDRVFFPGHCEDMPAAMLLADVVVSASVKPESFGRVAIEAQAMGTPVVATAHGGSLETVRDKITGWLVKPDDETEMATALGEAVSDSALAKQFGMNAREWVHRHFTARRINALNMAVYERLVFPADTIEKQSEHES